MVFVTSQELPPSFLFVVVAPDPVAAGVFRREESRCLMQSNQLFPFGRRITGQMPDCLGRFVGARGIQKSVVVVIDGRTTIHRAVAIGNRFPRAVTAAGDFGVTRLPWASQLKDRQTGTITESDIGPFQAAPWFFPNDPRGTMRDAREELFLVDDPFTEFIGFLDDQNLHRGDAGDDGFADRVRGQMVPQDHKPP